VLIGCYVIGYIVVIFATNTMVACKINLVNMAINAEYISVLNFNY